MKIETEIRDDHQARLTVELDESSMESAKQRAARKLARQIKIPGFRPGKAPYAVILRQVGEGPILEEATEILVEEYYPKVLEEAGIDPYGPGTLENIESLDPPKFEFLVPLKAEIELGDYRSVTVPYEFEPTPDEEVDRYLQDMRERMAVLEPVDRPVQESDMVYIRLSAKRLLVDGDEDPTLLQERPYPVIVESEDADASTEWPYPGFSRQLIGMQAGEEKTLTYTFPMDSQWESLQGVQAEFQVKVEEIKSRTLPELNDEFAQNASDFSTFDELYQKVREEMDLQAQREYHDSFYNNAVLDEIVKISTIKYPPQMLEHEIDHSIEHLKSRLAQENQDIDLYLKARQMDMEALREELRPDTESRLKRHLVLMKIAEVEKINVNPDELQSETQRTIQMMQRVLSKEEARRLTEPSAVQNLVGNIMMDMLIDKALERVRLIARGEAPPLPEAEAAETGAESVETAPEAEAEAAAEATAEAVAEAPAEAVEEAAGSAEGSLEDEAGAASQENE